VSIPFTLESTFAAGETTDVPLGEFLSRPVEIYTKTLNIGDNVDAIIDPWTLILNDPLVRRRVEGFKHFRGTCKARFVLTGNPLLFGRYIAHYAPRPLSNVHPLGSKFNNTRFIQASQHPHIFLDPTRSEGGEMEFPFFCPDNWLDLTAVGSVAAMGRIHFNTLFSLAHANSATGAAYLKIYAWFENVEICAPTSALYGSWTPQSEFSQSPVSKTASAVAKGAGLLARIPLFRPYALATEMAANAIANVASVFGFSRPAIVNNIEKYYALDLGEMAATNTHEVVQRLGTDVKGQLTVDPRTVGLPPVDELALSYILSKDTIFDRVQWSEAQPAGTVLNTINVTPNQFSTDTTTTPARTALTPQAAVNALFSYWKGTIIYRFHISASAFHRGKLRITYDPVSRGSSRFNEVYSRIIDIEECRDFEVPVHWHASQPYLHTTIPSVGSTSYQYGTTVANNNQYDNGQVSIEVLNELTSPDPSIGNFVQIDISHRMTDDAEFAFPSDSFATAQWSFKSSDVTEQPQSAIEADGLEEDNMPEHGAAQEGIGAGEILPSDHTNEVFMGESIPTLRLLLKRYVKITQNVLGNVHCPVRQVVVATSPIDCHEYITSMFVGWRGSTRFRVTKRTGLGNAPIFATNSPEGFYVNPVDAAHAMGPRGIAGNVDKLAIEVPFYYNKRFAHAKGNASYTSYTPVIFDPNQNGISIFSSTGNNLVFKSRGEDFNLFFFTGLPLLYKI
jgi:hypothetical protein